ncbi:MAG: hypothetical protein JWO66_446 [Candidatus Eremiobacteraeota bacterium]|nr:hypothetical protein [Candidatus Eremiobacteraeota bacterium]
MHDAVAVTGTTSKALRERAASVVGTGPRIVIVWGQPGWGKATFLNAFAEAAGGLAVRSVDFRDDAPDLVRPVLETLVTGDSVRAAASAAGRLAERPELAVVSARETLRLEWARPSAPEVFVLNDPSGTLATPAGIDLFGELVASLPGSRTLAVSTRTPLAAAFQQILARERVATVGPGDLALRDEDAAELAASSGVSLRSVTRLMALVRGWPMVSRLLIRLARADPIENLAEALATLPEATVFAFTVHRTIARLDDLTRDALVVASLLRGARQTDLVRVLGAGCDDFLIAQLASLPFVERAGERLLVHPDVGRLLHERFGPLVRELYDRTLDVLTGDGAYVAAAHVALEEGDVARAATALDAAPPYTAARVPLGEYERILDRLDRDVITRYPNVWLATIPYRAFSVDRATYVQEAETVFYCLPVSATPEQRAVVLIHLSSAYANVGRIAEGDQLVTDALAGFARDAIPARATLLRFAATMRGMDGLFVRARALAAEAESISGSGSGFQDNQTLHYIDAHEAAFRGRVDVVRVMFDELIRRLSAEQLPLYLAYAATNGAYFMWVLGDDDSFRRYLTVLDDSLTPGIRAGFQPMIDAAHGRVPQITAGHPWPVTAAVAYLYRVGAVSTHADALEAARNAVQAADERRDPYVQIVAHAALYVLDPSLRSAETAILAGVADTVESPEMREAVRRLIAGQSAGMLEPLVRRRLLRERERHEPRLFVELLAGRVTRDGAPLKLSDKEMELLALLASTQGTLSRDRIGEALWDHLDPEEWPNNLKVTLSRLRSKLGVSDAVSSANGGYRLSPEIDVDVTRAEALLRACRVDGINDENRGELRHILDAYRSGAATRYERFIWMSPALARINELVCTAGLLLARDALRNERYEDAHACAVIVAEIDPYNEGACEVTIRVFLARGEADAARREFRRYAKALASGLGAEPSDELAALATGQATVR